MRLGRKVEEEDAFEGVRVGVNPAADRAPDVRAGLLLDEELPFARIGAAAKDLTVPVVGRVAVEAEAEARRFVLSVLDVGGEVVGRGRVRGEEGVRVRGVLLQRRVSKPRSATS